MPPAHGPDQARRSQKEPAVLRAPREEEFGRGPSPTPKNVAALFVRRDGMLNEEQKEYPERLCDAGRALSDARRLTQEFNGMARNLEGEKLDG